MARDTAPYWDAAVVTLPGRAIASPLWRSHNDAVDRALVVRWLPHAPVGRVLKTDLFDETLGAGLYDLLPARARLLVGIDLSMQVLREARARHGAGPLLAADVRRLPFADGVFDRIVSTSTLDHFEALDDLVASLRELHRVLAPGGELLLTLDNLACPIVALRNALPFALLQRLGVLPYYVGVTVGPRRLRQLLLAAGFEVAELTATMHCPRVLAVALAGAVERHATVRLRRRLLACLLAWERLARWPTRFLTGHFLAARAVRPASGAGLAGPAAGWA